MTTSPSINDLLSQILAQQTSAKTSGAGAAKTGALGAEFTKLLELQMNQATAKLASLTSDTDDSSQSADDGLLASLGAAPSAGTDSAAQMQSLMLLRLLETVSDRIGVQPPDEPPASQATGSETVTGAPPAAPANS